MKIKVTNENIKFVVGLLKKSIKDNSITIQNKYNHKFRNIDYSNKDLFSTVKIEFDYSLSDNNKYIRIHNTEPNYKAFLIRVDDVLEFKGKMILHKHKFIIGDYKCINMINVCSKQVELFNIWK